MWTIKRFKLVLLSHPLHLTLLQILGPVLGSLQVRQVTKPITFHFQLLNFFTCRPQLLITTFCRAHSFLTHLYSIWIIRDHKLEYLLDSICFLPRLRPTGKRTETDMNSDVDSHEHSSKVWLCHMATFHVPVNLNPTLPEI